MRKLSFCLLLACSVYAQPWSGLIEPSRAIDWTAVGIPGGIPTTRTKCGDTILAATYNDGASDATSGIQTALNACSSDTYLLLGAGTFRINSSLSVPSNKTLRGSGAASTILNVLGSSTGAINLGSGNIGSTSITISSGATAGSSSIVVDSAAGMTAGKYLHITELNDADYVTLTGNEGDCTWCDGYWSGTRSRGQIVEITSVDGTTIGFTPALYTTYSATPQAVLFEASAIYAGVENVQVYANNSGYSANFLMSMCAYCWLKGVMGNYADGDHVEAFWSYRGEIRDSYFSNSYLHTSGQTDADIFLAYKTSGFLVENNILERLHASIMLARGPAGNVISYNYMFGNFDSSAENVLIANIDEHGAHPQFNLFEGNQGSAFYADSIWGSSSHETLFRNWWTATTEICDPMSGRSSIDCESSHLSSQANRAIQVASLQRYFNLIGNVVGSATVAGQMTESLQVVSPQTRAYSGTAYDYTFGYGGLSDSTGACASVETCEMYTTALLHGNYTNANSSIAWSGELTHTLPSSFYLSSKPEFFGSVTYPPIGPDVTGGSGPGSHIYDIPAKVCYDSLSKDAGGLGIFDAETCYAAAEEDVEDPVVTITSPTSSATYTVSTPTFALSGTASDNVGVSSVAWANDRGGSGAAEGTTSWSVTGITLALGENVITVTATDAAANEGTDVLTVTYALGASRTSGVRVSGGRVQ